MLNGKLLIGLDYYYCQQCAVVRAVGDLIMAGPSKLLRNFISGWSSVQLYWWGYYRVTLGALQGGSLGTLILLSHYEDYRLYQTRFPFPLIRNPSKSVQHYVELNYKPNNIFQPEQISITGNVDKSSGFQFIFYYNTSPSNP